MVQVLTSPAGTTTSTWPCSGGPDATSCSALPRADAPSASWEFDGEAVSSPTATDLRGRYLQGPPGGRFIYLSWGTVDGAGKFTLFRRAKLWLDAVPARVLDRAISCGQLVGRLGLTAANGNPVCGAVRPPAIEWTSGA